MNSGSSLRARLLASVFSAGILAAPIVAHAADPAFNIAPQSLDTALADFSRQSMTPVLATPSVTGAKQTPGYIGTSDPQTALAMLLQGTGLTFRRQGDTFLIVSASDPQSGGAAGDGADGTVQALIVTAQKREEDIQDVPIAISAFTQEDLTRSQVAGGPDLVTQVPNFTFTKTNFSGYSIQIRGIGTQAISATTDPAVAVAFNNTPFIRNRFFEQEFYDLERVEVLRGPQGTLYGRNATAGVVNIISAKPKFSYEAKLSADLGNYSSSRLEGMINLPLVEDKVALRIAGAWTKREGYVTNELTDSQTDGRDLWSTRLSLRFAPTDRLNANLIWEHFQEDDDRLRSGKQLCKKDVVTSAAGFPITDYYMIIADEGQGSLLGGPQATFSQGCRRESLYAADSFQRPNGQMLPYYLPLGGIGLPTALTDPYASVTNSSDPAVISATNDQPEDLRVIQSTIEPKYRATNDLGELQVSYELTDHLTLASETAYARDFVYSLEDYNRFSTAPGAWATTGGAGPTFLVNFGVITPEGQFCDPQLGCSDRLVAVDVSTAKARQFSQELRLSSDFDGAFNFSLGANFLRADSEDKYYVFINSLALTALANGVFSANHTDVGSYVAGQSSNAECLHSGLEPGDPNAVYDVSGCTYIDPNSIDSVNDLGHNYFLSKNPFKLISYAVFGEAYYNIADNLKLTAGLRFTVDKKRAPTVPTWLLVSQSVGYPVSGVVRQEWREPTGRLAVDWKPALSFTDETLLYASYAHGYKAGGANPPNYIRTFYATGGAVAAANAAGSATRPKTFDPEFVNAFEVGAKNTFLDGKATLNLAGFYYDYTGYQVSEIVDRSAFNRNFDATVWGLELESDWRPVENLKLGFKAGYEKTRIADGMQAVDLMDRTAGNPDWVVVRPFPTYASSCVLPAWLFVGSGYNKTPNPQLVNPGGISGGRLTPCEYAYVGGLDPITEQAYQANPYIQPGLYGPPINYAAWNADLSHYPGWPTDVPLGTSYPGWNPNLDYGSNHGEGFYKQLGGNELPNAPHFTATVTGDYTLPLPSDWLMTLHSDIHWQSQSWWRVFNDSTYDKLHPYFTMNLAAIFTNEDAGWNIMAYIKNVTDETAITGAFLNSDDTGLTTNVFLTEPRLYGLRVTKNWSGGPWWTGANSNHTGPYPFTVELGGMVQRHDASYETIAPGFLPAFSDAIDPTAAQHRDLDWGDGREVRLSYRPDGSVWDVSAGVRYGKTNSGTTRLHRSELGAEACGVAPFADYCDPGGAYYKPKYIVDPNNWSDTTARSEEKHTIVDFQVGRDLGLGFLNGGHSSLAAGVRYAAFDSTTHVAMNGTPDWQVPEEWAFVKYSNFHRYDADLEARREFKGAGPTLSWEASAPLLGSDEAGHVNLDWSLSGGVLFGKQKTSLSGKVSEGYWAGSYGNGFDALRIPTYTTAGPGVAPRSKSVSTPVVDLGLGLSYDIQRIKIGAGYRWERYFNILDAGYAERKEYDRTIDGPYFKIAVGFGG